MRSLSPPRDKMLGSQDEGRSLDNQSSDHRLMNQIMLTDHQNKLNAQAGETYNDRPNADRPKVLVGLGAGGKLIGNKYATLDEALENVEPHTTIFLTEGVYSISKPITKPGLIIEKRDKDEHVYIIGNEGPVIKIQLDHQEVINYVVFKNIIILHSGNMIQFKFKENAPQDPKYCLQASHKAIREFEI